MEELETSREQLLQILSRNEELEEKIQEKMYEIERIRVMEGVVEGYREKEKGIEEFTREMERRNLGRSEEVRDRQKQIVEKLEKELSLAREKVMYDLQIKTQYEQYLSQNVDSEGLVLKSKQFEKILDEKKLQGFNSKEEERKLENICSTIRKELNEKTMLVRDLENKAYDSERLLKRLKVENESYLNSYGEALVRYEQIKSPVYQEPDFTELLQRKDEAQRKLTAELKKVPIRENNKPREVKSICGSVQTLSTERSDDDDEMREYQIKERSLENCLGKIKHDTKLYGRHFANIMQEPVQTPGISVRKQIQCVIAGLILGIAAIYAKRIIIIT